jgi:hypothetical protein
MPQALKNNFVFYLSALSVLSVPRVKKLVFFVLKQKMPQAL